MLEDSFGRRFYYLRLSITDVCNFRCNYCLPDGYRCDHDRDFLSLAEISRLANGFARLGTEKIRITGGEPALRKDLPEIIQTVKNTDGIEHVAMTSNGFNLKQKAQDWIDAGLDSLNISIDSFDPRQFEAITGKNKLDDILSGIDTCLTYGLNKLKINTVLLREFNDHDLSQFFDFVKHTPVTLRFIELMQTGTNLEFYRQQHVSGQIIENALLQQGWRLTTRPKTAGPALEYQHHDFAGRIGLIRPYSKDFCSTCNRLRVSALGNLHLCLFADQGFSLREHLNSDDPQALQAAIRNLLTEKKPTHYLQQGHTGATTQLSMLGG
ncbi:GTP 3',8-cyclase MoaA [Thalassotalea mangrovi]|uniref:GTP 3',8-cyclase n=1 Tax=Thalassotalea mangrovi TaxID=2572245 RepID=A0A4U1BA50_9GAMM|nr:GTP 3',8-cyclase MoaA [Thalassotalea mangrovi]TKB47396.1 GTP 3',8-cyclase MoaA [Thalassotalea mangrovi]